MGNARIEQHHQEPDATSGKTLPRPRNLDVMQRAAVLLFANGQTTERIVEATARLAGALGCRVTLFAHWGELTFGIHDDTGSRYEIAAAAPLGVDMGKVAATVKLIEEVHNGRMSTDAASVALE